MGAVMGLSTLRRAHAADGTNVPKTTLLIEISPSWGQGVRLWLNRLRHPRDPWLAKVWKLGTKPHRRGDCVSPM
jgi:hypothetical protein